jgi:hypothetical protein
VAGGELQRIEDAQHLVEVAARRHGVDQDELHLLVRPDDEDVAQRRVLRGRALGRVALDVGREHPVELGHVEVGVRDQGVVRRGALGLLDVLRPLLGALERIDREADDLRAPLVELRLDAGHVAELGRADGGERARVREQHRPVVADPLVEPDATLGAVGLEVRGGIADRQAHVIS